VEGLVDFNWHRIETSDGFYLIDTELSDSIKGGEYLELLSNYYYLLKKKYAPWGQFRQQVCYLVMSLLLFYRLECISCQNKDI
jgi:hypothetical protein